MNLGIEGKLFIVTGATSGLGNGVARVLTGEGARIIAVARDQIKLEEFRLTNPHLVETVQADVTREDEHAKITGQLNGRFLSGVLINAGGPPAMSFLETAMNDWDEAYRNILRWKISLTKSLVPVFLDQKFGRMVFIESASVKQPVENLVLSNSLRLAVVGFVKTLSQELAANGITLNVLAPGFHDTPAAYRLYLNRSKNEGISVEEAKKRYESEIMVGRMGDTTDFGMIGAWLLSPHSGYITGQTFGIDGGLIKSTL